MEQQKQAELLKIIRENNMPVGASYLAEKMGLSQATIGRALLQLENLGMLQKVSNKGRQLTDQGLDFLMQHQVWDDKLNTARSIIENAECGSKNKLFEILHIRIALESLSAELASQNISDEELLKLDKIMLEHAYEVKRGGIGNEQDLQLHLTIAEASGNHTLAQMIKLILTQENAYTKFSMVAPQITTVQLKQHADIVDAIRHKESYKAKKMMILHLRQVMEDVRLHYHE